MKRLIVWFLSATIIAASLTGCVGGASPMAQQPAPASPPLSPTAQKEIEAYQARGALNGVIKQGDTLQCDASLATVSIGIGGREWNGTIFNVSDLNIGSDYIRSHGRKIAMKGISSSVKSGILRLGKTWVDDTDYKSHTVPVTVTDLAFNVPDAWQSNSTLDLYRTNFDNAWWEVNQLQSIDLCVEPRT